MAAEAIYTIKETEQKSRELVKEAGLKAQQILAAARTDSAAQKEAALRQAEQEKAALIEAAVNEARLRCDEVAAQGAAEREKIMTPDPARLESAINLVMERIVSV